RDFCFSDKFLKLKIPLFPREQKTKNRNLKFVIPAQAGIQSVEFQSFPINHRNVKFLDSRFRGNDGGEGLLFRINPCSFSFLDSRFRGNDGGGISVFPTNS
ncbi:TPA: hypothetical protein ACLAUT_002137, partial [Neisseria meningitidis]